MKKRNNRHHSHFSEIKKLCADAILKCDRDNCDRFATWKWLGTIICDTCKVTIDPGQVVKFGRAPEELDNASSIRKLALLLNKQEHHSQQQKNEPEIIHLQSHS